MEAAGSSDDAMTMTMALIEARTILISVKRKLLAPVVML
ncbi:hypothetical protein SVI_3691 [Shewanella violacea DSS12]|uniref:Uncharacterized protein n=1 Tax=Shewanella violacea (strain JCM 10179 / CIP 106290 / LMG 19151 / DSS12) TaxID=637905 RepID=D4ZCB7_SHEVD|nr:hypothetical protein SVI_3691 [Shewanella violacea DSS12]